MVFLYVLSLARLRSASALLCVLPLLTFFTEPPFFGTTSSADRFSRSHLLRMLGLDHLCQGGTPHEETIRLYGEHHPNLTGWVSRSHHAKRPPDALGLDPDPEAGRSVSDLYGNLGHVLLLLSPAA